MSYLSLRETSETLKEISADSINKSSKRRKERDESDRMMRFEHYMIKENARNKFKVRSEYKNAILTKNLNTALNAIYITALEQTANLSEADYSLAEAITERFIEEHGGARAVLNKMAGKTYLLDTLKTIVEDTTDEVVDGKKDDKEEAEKSAEEKNEKASEDAEETTDNTDDVDEEEIDNDSDEDTSEDEEEDAAPVEEEDPEVANVPDETKEEMLDRMESEKDVHKAVEVISRRISAAEEEFIKKNAEDKEKIENIVDDINDRIKAVNDDINKSEEEKEADVEEATRLMNRKISAIYNDRRHTIFEHMIHSLSETILKDEALRETYYEDSRMNMEKVVNTAKCLYGFLEFANALQLVKVDNDYIASMIKNI